MRLYISDATDTSSDFSVNVAIPTEFEDAYSFSCWIVRFEGTKVNSETKRSGCFMREIFLYAGRRTERERREG